jgi:hypothetical protein
VSAQLSYEPSTAPFPLQASPESGALSVYALTVVASNPAEDPNAHPVTLEGVQITLPVGEGGSQLTSDPGAVQPVPPLGWKLQPGTPAGVYSFVPTAGPVQVKGESIAFVLDQLAVNRQPGNVEGLEVAEGTGGCRPPNCPVKELPLTKFPYGWGHVDFWVDPPVIKANESTTLHWSGPEGATYDIEYGTRSGVVNIPAVGQPPLASDGVYPGQGQPPLTLDDTTVFTLTVTGTISGTRYTAQQQKTVTVQQALPTITKFHGTVARAGDDTYRLAFTWTTNAKDCEIPEAGPGLFGAISKEPADPVDVSSPAAGTFTLQANNDAGTATSTLTLAWAAAAQITIPGMDQPELPVSIALSPDGSRLYAVVNPEEGGSALTVIGLPSDPTAQPTQLATWRPPQATFLQGVTAVAAGAQDLVWLTAFSEALTLQYIPLLVSPDGAVTSGGPTTTLEIAAGGGPYSMATAPGGSQLYCAAGVTEPALQGRLWAYAVGSDRSLSPVGTASIGEIAVGAAVAADGTIYTTDADRTLFLYKLSGGALTLLGQQDLSGYGFAGDVAVAGDTLFVAGPVGVLVLDRTSLAPVRSPLAVTAGRLAVARSGMRLYASTTPALTIEIVTPSALTGGTG